MNHWSISHVANAYSIAANDMQLQPYCKNKTPQKDCQSYKSLMSVVHVLSWALPPRQQTVERSVNVKWFQIIP